MSITITFTPMSSDEVKQVALLEGTTIGEFLRGRQRINPATVDVFVNDVRISDMEQVLEAGDRVSVVTQKQKSGI